MMDSMNDKYKMRNKERYIYNLEAQLEKWESQIKQLEILRMNVELKENGKLQEEFENIKNNYNIPKDKINEIKINNGENAAYLVEHIEMAWNELKVSFINTMKKLND